MGGDGGTDTENTPPATGQVPEWQRIVIDRLRAAPDATPKDHAVALGVTERWFTWLIGSDAFQSLLARERLITQDPSDVEPPDPLSPIAPAPKSVSPILALQELPPSGVRPALAPGALQRLSFSHDAMVDQIIANPGIDRLTLGSMFGFSVQQTYKILASDMFRSRVLERKREIIDPTLVLSVEETLGSLLEQAAECVSQGLIAGDRRMAVRVLDTIGRYMAGVKQAGNGPTINNYVAVVPSKAGSAVEWVNAHGPTPLAPPIGV